MYQDFISPSLAQYLLSQARAVDGVPGLVEVGQGGGLESPESLHFLSALYEKVEASLAEVLRRRVRDRQFIDERVKVVLGLEDANGRIVIGPQSPQYCRPGGKPVAPLPEFLKGPHVTLFGPPDSAKMAINAMNAYHRKLPNEPAIVEEFLTHSCHSCMWGADDEDSKTPLRKDLVSAAVNLTACLEGALSLQEGDKCYELAQDHLSLPIKRFPGLALPSTFLFYRGNPIPLHLYDFALHLFRNWNNPRALVFYVPKLENEEEAQYLHQVIATAESMIQAAHPSYILGSVRLMIVLENPRAILRTHEIMDALYPYFAGASLGWHDYLASTARVFKEDSDYRIPVKADPNIVIKYIKASHRLLADTVGSRGGIKVGGMYGILPLAGNPESLQIALRGFIKDVITQMKRDLTGFWVAHPDFVRLGLALVEAWKRHAQQDSKPLFELVQGLLDEKYHNEILDFIRGSDLEDLDIDSPHYVRSLLVADLKESDFRANHDPEEIRYNVRQSLQYLADWLSGNGCVALPTAIDGVAVRVMDDLATAERSRWEVWHELRHGRFKIEDFLQIAHEEMNFIRRNLSTERTSQWYPIAMRIMLKLMTDPEPVEFATQLLLPFTVESIRDSADPWKEIQNIDPDRYRLPKYVSDFDHYFEVCGSQRFARAMAQSVGEDSERAREIIASFTLDEIVSAASFHGDIGQSKKTLDARAASEQAQVLASSGEDPNLKTLREMGEEYRKKFGFKYLVSAAGRSAEDLLKDLKSRINGDRSQEMDNARRALWEITERRMRTSGRDLKSRIEALRVKHRITGAAVAVNYRGQTQALAFGESEKGKRKTTPDTRFQLASLSKTIASAHAIEVFRAKGIPLSASVNGLLAKYGSSFRLSSDLDASWADQVTLADLMSHSALNMHYVKGIPDGEMPPVEDLLRGNPKYGYDPVSVISEPGKMFRYSGGGFLVLEHLLELLGGKGIGQRLFPENGASDRAHGYLDSGEEVPGGGYRFPTFAAGGLGSSGDMARFLLDLTQAYQELDGAPKISHDTAVEMLHGQDRGSRAFMGCDMGLGVFTAEAGPNRLAIHQGANEGFRAIFIQCFDGPDCGKGLVVLCNGDNRGVLFISEVVRELLTALEFRGIDFGKIAAAFDLTGLPQEQIVNLGYKSLIFDAFEEDLPEAIIEKGALDPLAHYNLAVDARILSVTNQKFARAENLLSPYLPVFDPELFGRQGKVMDSWESVRHNSKECDTLELELAQPSTIRFVSLSTLFHDGNHPEYVRIRDLLLKTPAAGHSLLKIDLGESPTVHSKLRIDIFPDGGLSRLGLFKDLPQEEASKFLPLSSARWVRSQFEIPKTRKPLTVPYRASPKEVRRSIENAQGGPIDWASLAFGGSVVHASNEHYGPAAQVISPYPPIHMFDGLESARSRKPGHFEEVVLKLGKATSIEKVILDFTFFVNNNPLDVSIAGLVQDRWVELVERARVKAFAGNLKEFRISPAAQKGPFSQIRVRTYPDGGMNRIRVLGPAG